MGRDWIVVRLMPRTANSVRISSSAPGWSSIRNAASDVRSAPVRAGSGRGGDTTTNRVTAVARSWTSGAMTSRPYRDGGEGTGQRGVDVPVGGLAGRLGVGGQRDPLAVGQVGGEPAAALRHGLRVAADPLDVADRGPRLGQQRERDGDLQFRPDDQVVPGGQAVEGRGDDALDRALDRHHGPFRRTVAHRGESGLDGRAGQRLGVGVDGTQRRLGERPLGTQVGIRHSPHDASPRGARRGPQVSRARPRAWTGGSGPSPRGPGPVPPWAGPGRAARSGRRAPPPARAPAGPCPTGRSSRRCGFPSAR